MPILFSCGKDFTKPALVITKPFIGDNFRVDSLIEVAGYFQDDEIINQFKIRLVLAPPSEKIDSTFDNSVYFTHNSFLYISETGYNSDSLQHFISLPPQFLPGNYYLIVSALNDQNIEDKDTIQIFISHPLDTLAPTINLASPLNGSSYSAGDSMSINGIFTEVRSDNTPAKLYHLRITLVPEFAGQNGFTLLDLTWPDSNEIDFKYEIPTTAQNGVYTLYILLLDEFNNSFTEAKAIYLN